MKQLNGIFQKLGIDTTNGLYYTDDTEWKSKLQFPNRIVRLLENNIKPDAFFCIDNKPLILFFENPTDSDLHKKIWNFNETPIVIISQNDVVEIFNGFKYEKELKSLAKIGNSDKLTDFTYFHLVTEKIWETYQDELSYNNRVDYKLLTDIKTARKSIIDTFPKVDEKDVEIHNLYKKITNALLGKIIFVRYLIDREVILNYEGKSKKWTNSEFCELLGNPKNIKAFFGYLVNPEIGFNGNLFPITQDEYNIIPDKAYKILIKLLNSQEISTGQLSLFDLYDFSVIPTEFISNVYESFVGVENQATEGVYYTPLFLVDYILSETIGKHIKIGISDGCKTLDPACGSGVFLVETLRKLIEQYKDSNPQIFENDKEKFKEAIKNIAKENIFGIDKDESAVQVAVFSIYLTLLNEMNPPEIATFKFPNLLGTNFFCDDFFNETAGFNSVFQDKDFQGFDFIIGNPPWKGGALGSYGETYIKERKKKDKAEKKKYLSTINNGEVVEGFVLRVSDFSKTKTKLALIVRSSILYNKTDDNKFRKYWLEEFFVNKIVELAPVRREVFDKSNDKAIAPAAILFYQYANGKITDDNVLEHITIKPTRFFSYFKILTINRTDYKKVEQSLLKLNDWLFKTLVYGSYLDFNLITRLKKNYPSVKDIISDENKFAYGTGIHYSTEELENPKNTQSIKNFPLISSYAIDAYVIDYENKKTLKQNNVDNIGDKRLYRTPMLLIREGIDTQLLNAKAAVSAQNILFKSSITSVVSIENTNNDLKTILGIILSDLYSYLAINIFASIGIEREKAEIYNKFSVPFIDCDIIEFVETIERAKIQLHYLNQQDIIDNIECSKVQKIIDNAQNEINKAILDALHFNEVEKTLLDYALTINRPLITRTQKDKYKILGKLQEPSKIHSNLNYSHYP
ncbi:type I endonuclease-methyltransferase fusion protein [Bacteroidia bacterium]|nr:type I endonuclease-methyltransferase fusion protein [Bacteroidia bacterium]GHV70319.1 type I endonuclease-methyltransferase fusion protein [Bacteroidia bacterium]